MTNEANARGRRIAVSRALIHLQGVRNIARPQVRLPPLRFPDPPTRFLALSGSLSAFTERI